MNIYIDESGSITNQFPDSQPYFVIALVHVKNREKLCRAYKRFVSSNEARLRELDHGSKMFRNGKFRELKGNQFDRQMKIDFVNYFARNHYFELYYIKFNNTELSDRFCQNTSRAFNYVMCQAMRYFFSKGYLIDEGCYLQLDERNEKTEAKTFLENYLNTQLIIEGIVDNEFTVLYFDSSNNQLVQIADVFSNLFYSHLKTGAYEEQIHYLKKEGYLRCIYEFPSYCSYRP